MRSTSVPSSTLAPTNLVRRFRERKRLTLKQLETLTGLQESHLSKIERRLISPNGITKEKLAEALNTPREILFPEDGAEEATA